MAFWGLEVKPGAATPYVPPPEASKLHLSQVRAWPGVAERRWPSPAINMGTSAAAQGLRTGLCTPQSTAGRPPARFSLCARPRPGQACLSPAAKDGQRAALLVRVGEGEPIAVCMLRGGATECANLDLIFDQVRAHGLPAHPATESRGAGKRSAWSSLAPIAAAFGCCPLPPPTSGSLPW